MIILAPLIAVRVKSHGEYGRSHALAYSSALSQSSSGASFGTCSRPGNTTRRYHALRSANDIPTVLSSVYS